MLASAMLFSYVGFIPPPLLCNSRLGSRPAGRPAGRPAVASLALALALAHLSGYGLKSMISKTSPALASEGGV